WDKTKPGKFVGYDLPEGRIPTLIDNLHCGLITPQLAHDGGSQECAYQVFNGCSIRHKDALSLRGQPICYFFVQPEVEGTDAAGIQVERQWCQAGQFGQRNIGFDNLNQLQPNIR